MVDQAKRRCWFSAEKVLPLYQDQVAAWLHARWAMGEPRKEVCHDKRAITHKTRGSHKGVARLFCQYE
jgi:hypothetical protein